MFAGRGQKTSYWHDASSDVGYAGLTDTAGTLTVTGISQTGGGSVTIGNTGALSITGTVSAAGAGAINLTEIGRASRRGREQITVADLAIKQDDAGRARRGWTHETML